MQPRLTEAQFRPELRLRICTRCPLRSGRGVKTNPNMPQPCEKTCPLFLKLGELVRRAVLADQMLCPRERVLEHLVHEPPRAKRHGNDLPLRRQGREVVRLITGRIHT